MSNNYESAKRKAELDVKNEVLSFITKQYDSDNAEFKKVMKSEDVKNVIASSLRMQTLRNIAIVIKSIDMIDLKGITPIVEKACTDYKEDKYEQYE